METIHYSSVLHFKDFALLVWYKYVLEYNIIKFGQYSTVIKNNQQSCMGFLLLAEVKYESIRGHNGDLLTDTRESINQEIPRFS